MGAAYDGLPPLTIFHHRVSVFRSGHCEIVQLSSKTKVQEAF